MSDWDDYRYATAVARAGTVRGAAAELGVHASTVTRRIDQFERRLGLKLFTRSVRGLSPTAEGRAVVEALARVSEDLAQLEHRLVRNAGEMAGDLHLVVSPALTPDLVMSALHTLVSTHPGIRVSLSRRWSARAVQRRKADVAVVVAPHAPGDLVGRSTGAMALCGWANADTATRWPNDCPWLPSRLQQETAPDLEVHADAAPVGGAIDAPELQISALRAGLGASLLPVHQARADAQLVQLAQPRASCEIWVLSHPDARGVRRVQALVAALVDTLRDVDLAAPV